MQATVLDDAPNGVGERCDVAHRLGQRCQTLVVECQTVNERGGGVRGDGCCNIFGIGSQNRRGILLQLRGDRLQGRIAQVGVGASQRACSGTAAAADVGVRGSAHARRIPPVREN